MISTTRKGNTEDYQKCCEKATSPSIIREFSIKLQLKMVLYDPSNKTTFINFQILMLDENENYKLKH